ncbi:MAG TPA: amino acid ABC transporter permease [Alphaproteobacteria bacterium]|nr:amino acid ABC transporter permease [Alphaproteobacteria bacterium]
MSPAQLEVATHEWMPQLLVAALGTLEMTALAYVLGATVGLLIALAGHSPRRFLSAPARFYVEIVRGTPALTQLFLIYFGLASVGIAIPAFETAVLGLGLNYAAYMAEVYRAGIEAIHRGQREAAQSIGMTHGQTMRHIVLPQAVRVILPPMANYAISLLKDTSVASLISAPELMLRARDLSSEYYMPMQLYLIAGTIYFVMAFPLSRAVRRLERVLGKGHAAGAA